MPSPTTHMDNSPAPKEQCRENFNHALNSNDANPDITKATGDSTTSSSKKKKKKPSRTTPAEVNPYYKQAMQSFPVMLRNTKTKGRHAAAAEELKQGTTVCLEQATAYVVRSEFSDKHCHVCLDMLTTKLMCQDCRKAFYCSEACLGRDDTHTLVCSTLKQIDSIGHATNVEPDLLRLITLLLARRQRDSEKDTVAQCQSDEIIHPTPFWCTNDLISHREQADRAFVRVVAEASERLMSEWQESMRISVDDFVTLACRINSNAHGLGDNEGRNTDVAFGLFPLGAMFFNHSCNPNCAFVGLQNGQLAFRTIRPVSREEELTVSYIDLYAPRDERRHVLLGSKHFWCKCKRCISPIETSIDRYLTGVVCEKCHEDVYVIPPSTMDNIQVSDPSAKSSDNVEYKCAKCSSKTTSRSLQNTLEEAQKMYMEGMMALRKYRNYRQAQSKLQPLAKVSSNAACNIHPQNAVRLNACIPLMNCLRHNDDIAGAIDVNRFILEIMEKYAEQHLPRNTAEISDFYQNLGELCKVMADKYSALGRRPLEKRYRNEAKSAFNHAIQVRSVVFGSCHPKTKLVIEQATSVFS